jgi:TetR/AcrR family transcriptional regulator
VNNSITTRHEAHVSREKIFKTAARLFSEKGYNGVSMREISEYTGLSKPTIYYYFGNKEGIYSALVEASIETGIIQIEKILRKNISVKDKLIEFIKARFEQVYKYPELIKFFLSLFNTTENLPFLEHFRQDAMKRHHILSELISEGIASGEFGASARPELASELYLGIITHFLWNQLNSPDPILSDQLAEEIVEILFKGLNE